MMTNQTLMSDLAIPPGEFLSEILEDLQMTQKDLAKRMGRPVQAINEMIKGNKAITPETAIQLEKVVSVPSHIWTNLESEYRLLQAKAAEELAIAKEGSLVSKFPYADLVKQAMVKPTRDKLIKVRELRKFFGVSSLRNLDVVESYNPAFRLAANNGTSKEAIAAWLRTGSLLSKQIETNAYSKADLLAAIPLIKELTLEDDQHAFVEKLKTCLASCGVALIVIPHYPKTYVSGATFWETKNKAVIMMSLRGSWGDIFWFSLLHEIGHIVLHGKRSIFIEGKTKDEKHKKQESEADKFASDHLIPQKAYSEFAKDLNFTQETIQCFAEQVGIHPGIVTGRLQHDGLLPYSKHLCRVHYKW